MARSLSNSGISFVNLWNVFNNVLPRILCLWYRLVYQEKLIYSTSLTGSTIFDFFLFLCGCYEPHVERAERRWRNSRPDFWEARMEYSLCKRGLMVSFKWSSSSYLVKLLFFFSFSFPFLLTCLKNSKLIFVF